MKKEDLKSGYLVEFINEGKIGLGLIMDCKADFWLDSKLSISSDVTWFPVNELRDDLTYIKFKITKVYGLSYPRYAHRLEVNGRKLLWERE